jgi:rare lipoprotein A
MKTRATIAAAAALALATGCAPGQPPEDVEAPATEAPAADPLSLQSIPDYPVLHSAPAPPPRPSPDADPHAVPERVASALPEDVLETVTGEATFYADRFEGRRTASGIPFRQNQMVAAHRAYPFGTVLRVTNMANERSVTVRVVDRGPYGAPRVARRKVIDLSRRAAQQIGMIGAGRAVVQVEVLEWGEGIG